MYISVPPSQNFLSSFVVVVVEDWLDVEIEDWLDVEVWAGVVDLTWQNLFLVGRLFQVSGKREGILNTNISYNPLLWSQKIILNGHKTSILMHANSTLWPKQTFNKENLQNIPTTMFDLCRVNGLAVRRQAFGLFDFIVIGQTRQLILSANQNPTEPSWTDQKPASSRKAIYPA